MENKLKFILAGKKCSEPDIVISKFMRYFNRCLPVGFDYQEVTDFLDHGNEVEIFKESELEKLKEYGPKAIFLLILGEKDSLTLDSVSKIGEKYCDIFGEDVNMTWVADFDKRNVLEMIAVR